MCWVLSGGTGLASVCEDLHNGPLSELNDRVIAIGNGTPDVVWHVP